MTSPRIDLVSSRWRTYRDVDASGIEETLNDNLDRIASIPAVAATKRASVELLALSPGAHVLDVGCGNGTELPQLAAVVGAGGHVVGLDHSTALLKHAQLRAQELDAHIELVAADACSMPFPDGCFDACRADRTLQHVEELDACVLEMIRVTRGGGRIVSSEVTWSLARPDDGDAVPNGLFGDAARNQAQGHSTRLLLPMIFTMHGLRDVMVYQQPFELHDYDEIERFTDLHLLVDEGVRRGELEAQAGRSWLARLRDEVAAGESHLSATAVHIVATKPGA